MLVPEHTNMKRCRDCRIDKPTDDGRKWNGNQCPSCLGEWQKRYLLDPDNYERRKASNRKSRKRPEARAAHALREAERRLRIDAHDDGSINAESLEELRYDIQDNRCAYCWVELDDSCHLDHVEPLARGGWHQYWNVLYACPPCNIGKRDKLIAEWIL